LGSGSFIRWKMEPDPYKSLTPVGCFGGVSIQPTLVRRKGVPNDHPGYLERTMSNAASGKSTKWLWAAQVLLALTFLLTGTMKLILPAARLTSPVPLPVGFIRFIGVCEIMGALGMVLPGLFRVMQRLTPAAAVGLVLIMTGATVITAMGGMPLPAIAPLILGGLAAIIAYGRRDWLRA
jgi:hypothetical protein